ncbi:MAG: dihydroorotate dehydrogenase electron transfer subunit [Deltaproteobacteria bacterium]|nr:dihydroorotate dehydrogenase electron transfer subunit [Deltaproteobacteria bacterium]
MLAEILSNKKISEGYCLMQGVCPGLTNEIVPGQFAMLKVTNGNDLFLRRPFSFHRIGYRGAIPIFEILYRVVGPGTQIMAAMKTGQVVDIIGPLGRGFSFAPDLRTAIIVAGGMGIAPLVFLLEEIKKTNQHKTDTILLYGGQSKNDILEIERLRQVAARVKICTEDGSLGYRMRVTELLEQVLQNQENNDPEQKSVSIFACGPFGMLKSTSVIAEKFHASCDISLETPMACGFGACLGCVVKVHETDGASVGYALACHEGPVFNSKTIIWDE